jgi:hypothetical protein
VRGGKHLRRRVRRTLVGNGGKSNGGGVGHTLRKGVEVDVKNIIH